MNQKLIDEVLEAREQAYDEARPEAVARVHDRGHLTARERISAMLDPGSFVEFGVLAQPMDPAQSGAADGLVDGVGTIDGSPIAISSYDYSVYGGTQSGLNHGKLDRMIELAYDHRWPFLCFADGGGARAQNLESTSNTRGISGRFGTFDGIAALSGWVPTVAVVSGRSFAGNASIAGLSDFIVVTRDSAIGMGGPPLVEAALGLKLTPEELGPAEMHERVGGLDLLVDDEPAAITAARKYLTYFLGDLASGEPSPTADTIRSIVPENRRRAYDMRKIVAAVANADSVLELRPNWGRSLITSLVRMDGRSVGVIANQPLSEIGGAIDSNAADKISRFVQLCDAHDLPMVSFIDNPGFMLGPEAEQAGIARHHARTILTHAHRTVPLFCVQIKKAYGLGPQGMGKGQADLALAWPSTESGGARGGCVAGAPRRDRSRRGRGRRPRHSRQVRGWAPRAELGPERRPALCVRRCDRSGGDAGSTDRDAALGEAPAGARQEEALRRRLVVGAALPAGLCRAQGPGPSNAPAVTRGGDAPQRPPRPIDREKQA